MSDGLNKVMVIGNVGREPEMRYTANGAAVTTFSVAVNRRFNDKDETEWFNVVTWSKLAELLGQHLKKGRKVYIEGRLTTRQWEKDGAKHYRTEVVASQVLFLDRAKGAGALEDFGEGEIDPEDLPFE